MPNPIVEVADQQKEQLRQRNEQLTNSLTRAYIEVLNDLDSAIQALNQEILNQENLSSSKLFRLARYTSLQTQIIEQLQRFAGFADLTIRSEIPEILTIANQDSFALVREQFQSIQGRRAITSAWDFMNQEQIEQTLALLTNNSPFNLEYTSSLGETVADRIEQELIKAVVVGQNPRETARVIHAQLGLSLARILNTARTAQIYSYRTAAHLNYRNNSDVVKSWVWYSARDLRTCPSCWAKHGSVYPVNQILNDHHQGRCIPIPQIRDAEKYGLEDLDIERGDVLFSRLPANQQQEILGPTKFELYQRNAFRFEDLSRDYENTIYGTMVRESTVQELINE